MTQLFGGICHITVTAGTGIGCVTLFGAGGIGYHGLVIMSGGFNGCCFEVVTAGAISALGTVFGTGGFFDNCPVAHIMAGGGDFLALCDQFSAVEAVGVAGVAIFSTGSFLSISDFGFACMIVRIQFSVGFLTTGTNCLVNTGCSTTGMTQFCCFITDVTITATTRVGGVAILGAGGAGNYGTILMNMLCNYLKTQSDRTIGKRTLLPIVISGIGIRCVHNDVVSPCRKSRYIKAYIIDIHALCQGVIIRVYQIGCNFTNIGGRNTDFQRTLLILVASERTSVSILLCINEQFDCRCSFSAGRLCHSDGLAIAAGCHRHNSGSCFCRIVCSIGSEDQAVAGFHTCQPCIIVLASQNAGGNVVVHIIAVVIDTTDLNGCTIVRTPSHVYSRLAEFNGFIRISRRVIL